MDHEGISEKTNLTYYWHFTSSVFYFDWQGQRILLSPAMSCQYWLELQNLQLRLGNPSVRRQRSATALKMIRFHRIWRSGGRLNLFSQWVEEEGGRRHQDRMLFNITVWDWGWAAPEKHWSVPTDGENFSPDFLIDFCLVELLVRFSVRPSVWRFGWQNHCEELRNNTGTAYTSLSPHIPAFCLLEINISSQFHSLFFNFMEITNSLNSKQFEKL